MHFVYIIQSLIDHSYYKGYSSNPYDRLEQHNNKLSTYTSTKCPWRLVAIFEFKTKTEALSKEKKIKKYSHVSLIALISSEKNILNNS
jgi:putative endonuclease